MDHQANSWQRHKSLFHLPNTFLEDHREQGDTNTLARHCYHLDELPSSLEIMTEHHSSRITHHRRSNSDHDTCNNNTRELTHKTSSHFPAFRLNNPLAQTHTQIRRHIQYITHNAHTMGIYMLKRRKHPTI